MNDAQPQPDSPQAWWRLFATLGLMTIGSAGMYVVSVMLPAVQAEFGISRAEASFPYTLLMIGFGIGCVVMGKLADRVGIVPVIVLGAVSLGAGFIACGWVGGITSYALVQGLFIGLLGSSTTFVPLIADTSLWFVKRRGVAVAVCASGNYVAGAIWPPVVQHFVETAGWRPTCIGLGIFSMVTMLALALAMRAKSPAPVVAVPKAGAPVPSDRPFGLSLAQAQLLLCVAGTACCVAMAMPQVHIVAYCGDLGFGAARGAEMLSLMLGAGIVSRLVSGWICDRIGGVRTLLLGSFLQGVALLLFIPFDSLASLYVVSALFGLFQGGIVPSYAIIVREHFPPAEAGARVGAVISCTLFGMALGGWMSGKVFDLTGSYHAAFINGALWNALNLSVALFLLWRVRRGRGRPRGPRPAAGPPAPPPDVLSSMSMSDAMPDTLQIDPRHNGPRTSGNGGWVAGALARRLTVRTGAAVASVALRAPVPLGRPLPLRWQAGDALLELLDGDGGSPVADAAPSTLDLAVPAAPTDDVAEAAGVAARLRHQQRGLGDPYAHCFVCGFARPDGLGVIVGPVNDDGLMATTWTPPAALAAPDGRLPDEVVWAALDCPAGMAWSHRLGRGQQIMTVRMTARIDRPLQAGDRYRVLAWPLHQDGRKLHAGTAIVDGQGAVCALSQQLWLLPREAV